MTNQLANRIRSVASLAWTSGLPHLIVALIAIQGASYIVQLAIARSVTPADFGIVRTVESSFAVALVIAVAGIPSLAIKSVAAMDTPQSQGRLLRRLVGLVLVTSTVTAAVVSVAARFIVSPGAAPWLAGLAFLLIPVAIARTCVNFFQALRIVQRISMLVAIGSATGLVIVVALVARYGLTGWLAGRYVAEAILAGIALGMCWRYLKLDAVLPASVHSKALLLEGTTVSSSLLVRSAIDNVPVLSLGWFAVAAADIGYFGLGSLIAAALLLLPAAMNTLAIAPLVTRLRQGTGAARRLFVRVHLASAVTTVPVALCLIAALPWLLRIFAPAYLSATGLLRALIAVVPLRAATTASGNTLLAAGRIRVSLWFNVATLALCLATLTVLVPRHGATGAVIAIVVSESASAVMFAWGASRSVGAASVSNETVAVLLSQELAE